MDVHTWVEKTLFKNEAFIKELQQNFKSMDMNQNKKFDAWFEILDELEDIPINFYNEDGEENDLNMIVSHLFSLNKKIQSLPRFKLHFFDDIFKVNSDYIKDWISLMKMDNRDEELIDSLIEEITSFADQNQISSLLVILIFLLFSQNK